LELLDVLGGSIGGLLGSFAIRDISLLVASFVELNATSRHRFDSSTMPGVRAKRDANVKWMARDGGIG